MFHTLIVLLYLFISCNKSLDVQMIGLLKTSLTFILISDMASPMRVHAVGPTNPNIDPHYGRIPALDQKRIIWDGIPRPDFEEVFFEYLMHLDARIRRVLSWSRAELSLSSGSGILLWSSDFL